LSEVPPDDRITRSWLENAGAWTRAVRGRAMESRRVATDQAILDAVLACGGERVLDVGCGEGWLSRRLDQAGRDVVGFDGSPALIEEARGGGGGVRFIALDYDAFASDPGAVGVDYDVAVCNFSLLGEHVGGLLAGLRCVTRPGGHLLVQTVHPFFLAGTARYEDGWQEENYESLPGEWSPMPWYFRTFGSWVRELGLAGWRLDACREPLHPATGQPVSLILVAL
jgi:2-polyprenyl-3-methyl-5-hydroxy-6-metoxy-1,4-benzoquinol methylase